MESMLYWNPTTTLIKEPLNKMCLNMYNFCPSHVSDHPFVTQLIVHTNCILIKQTLTGPQRCHHKPHLGSDRVTFTTTNNNGNNNQSVNKWRSINYQEGQSTNIIRVVFNGNDQELAEATNTTTAACLRGNIRINSANDERERGHSAF